jgi:hypothetical protein
MFVICVEVNFSQQPKYLLETGEFMLLISTKTFGNFATVAQWLLVFYLWLHKHPALKYLKKIIKDLFHPLAGAYNRLSINRPPKRGKEKSPSDDREPHSDPPC